MTEDSFSHWFPPTPQTAAVVSKTRRCEIAPWMLYKYDNKPSMVQSSGNNSTVMWPPVSCLFNRENVVKIDISTKAALSARE